MLPPAHKTNRSPSAERQPSSEPWTRPRQTNWNVDCEVIHNIYMEKKNQGKYLVAKVVLLYQNNSFKKL